MSDGFAGKELNDPDLISLGQSTKKGNNFFIGYVDQVPVSASCLYVHNKFARLGGMTTLSRYQGLGFQSEMIRLRIKMALESKCTHIISDTQPGNQSQSNLEKSGFRIIYTRNILRKIFQLNTVI